MNVASTPSQATVRTPIAVVVNDDLTQIEVLTGLLGKEGLDVRSFSDATSALEAMSQVAPPDLIVTDLYMPGLDGWRFCRLLRSPDYAPFNHVPIMAVSATFAGEEAARVTADLGANAFLAAPVDGREFTEQVRQLLRGEQPQKFLRVLIVEDDEGLAGLLQQAFVAHGYQADTAPTGHQAEAKFKAKDYDVVVIDQHLPDIPGEQLLEHMQQQCNEVVYVAMTGDSRPELALELMKRGAAAFVRKPFAPQYLVELCAKARRERDLLWVEHRLEIRTRELRQSEERFRQMADNIDSVFWITNREISQMIYVSPAYEKIWGRTCESLYQQPRSFLDVVHPEDRERMMESLRTASPESQGPFEIEYRIARPDGSFRWIRDRGFPVQDQAAQRTYMVGISDDITERKRAEHAILQASEETKSILASISDAFFSLDNQLLVTYWNDAAERMLHRRREEVLGRNLFHVFPEARGSVFEINYTRAAQEQVRLEFETYFGVPPYENWYQVRVYPRGNGISVYFQVITDRKRLEEDLKAANARLEALWSVSSVAAADIKTISDHILRTIGRMTRSAYGFYGFVNEDESIMTIHSWSGDAMKDCAMVDKPSNFTIADAGVWGEAIRRREPFILNNYADAHPAKKGLPIGHVPLTNLLVLPHMVQGRIRSVAAVANRAAPYTQDDVTQLTSFLDHIQAIIENKRAEVQLRELSQRLTYHVDHSPLAVIEWGSDMRLIRWSGEAERLFGWKAEEVLGKRMEDFRWIYPEDELQVKEGATDLVTGANLQRFSVNRHYRKDGSVVYCEWHNSSLLDESREIRSILSLVLDITERKRAEAALRQNETLLRMAGRTARFGGWRFDLTGQSVVWSEEVALIHEKEPGYSPTVEEAIQFYTPEWREKIARVFAACVREGTPFDEEMEIVTARGHHLWVRATGEADRDGSGNIVRVYGAFQDITEYKQVTADLLHKTAILEAQLDSTADGILIVDNQGKKVIQNQRTIDLWKIPQYIADNADDEVQVKHVMHMTKHPDRFVEQVNHLYRHPDEISREEIELTDGTVLDRYSAPVLDKDGHNHGRIWTFHDITERKRAEMALRQAESRYRNFVHNASEGIYRIDFIPPVPIDLPEVVQIERLSEAALVGEVNDALARMYGLTTRGMVGHRATEFAPEYGKRAQRVLQSPDFQVRDEETQDVDPTGRIIHLLENYTGVIEQGRLVHIWGMQRDITERKFMVESLRQSEQRHRTILQTALDGFWCLDPEGRLLDVNEAYCRMSGYDRDTLLTLRISDLETIESAAETMTHVQKVMIEKQDQFETRHRRKDGSLYDMEVRVQYQSEAGGLMFAFLRDITQRKQAEEVLRKSEEKWRNILLQTPQIGIALDPQATIVFANRRFLELTGWMERDVLGRDWFDLFIPEEVREEVRGMFNTVMHARDTLGYSNYENDILTRTGERLSVAWSNVITRDPSGAIVDVTCLGIDVSERKRSEKMLRESEERYRLINASIMDLIYSYDRQGRFTHANLSLCNFLGLEASQIVGKTHEELGFPPEQCAEWTKLYQQVYDTGSTVISETTTPIQGGAQRHFEVVLNPMRDESGAIVGISGTTRDITLRKHAEKELQESEARFKALHNASFGGIAIHDKGVILACNKGMSEMTGYSLEELTGMDGLLLIAPQSRNNVMANIVAGYEKPYEAMGIRKNGEEYYLRLEARNVPYKGKMVRTVEFRDITDRKQAEAERERLQVQLVQAQKMESVGRLAGGVAHDFNNMLAAILGNVSYALQDLPPNSPLRENLEEIEKCAQRSADLTRQLLAFARKQTVAPKVLNLNATVEGMLKMLQRLIGEDIHVSWLPAQNLWTIKIDPSQIDQILANLCVNARDAINGVGKVELETSNVTIDSTYAAKHPDSVPGDYVLLAVSDNGCGMSPEIKAHLFEPFFTTKGVGQGTGLGLATVYGIVKQNLGFINVYSEPSHGTTFKIYLPRHEDKAVQLQKVGPAQPASRGHETILLVEDEPALLRISRRALEGLGYTMLAASTPGEAIHLAAEYSGQIDLLITDVVMPEMNGRELAKRLLSLYPNLKRLFMSGYTANVIAHHGVLEEGIQFLQKPFTVEILADKVREAIGSA